MYLREAVIRTRKRGYTEALLFLLAAALHPGGIPAVRRAAPCLSRDFRACLFHLRHSDGCFIGRVKVETPELEYLTMEREAEKAA
jgi:hypothetical protein